MSRQILSIEIRKDHIAAVLLNTGLKSGSIAGCTRVPIHPDTESGDADPLVRALKALTGQIDTASASVMVSIPADRVIFRSLTIPFKEASKIRQVLPFELEPIVPVNIDNLTVDFQSVPMGDQSRVFAAAVDSGLIQDLLERFTEAGLPPQIVVPGGLPLALQISELDDQATDHTLILDIDRNKTTLFALTGGHIALVRTIPYDPYAETGTNALALRVRQTLTALGEGHVERFSPAAVYVTGPGLDVEGSVEKLSKALELPVGTIDFRRLLTHVGMDNQVQWNSHLFNNALALANLTNEGGKCPNFHHISSPLRNFLNTYRPYIMGPAVLFAIVLLLGLGGVVADSYFLKKRVDLQNSEMAAVFRSTFPDSRLTAPPLDQMKSKLTEVRKGNIASRHPGSAIRTIDILLELSQRVPRTVDVVLSRMTVGAEAVTVSGETADFNTVDDIKGRIEKSDLFSEVTIASANMDKSGKKVRFKLKIDL
jgi:hypothetical protein